MFDLPILMFKIALADLINLAATSDGSPLSRRDLDVIRPLLTAAINHLNHADDADDDDLAAATQIRDLALKTLTRRLESLHATQQSTPGHRLTTLDLAALAIYRRVFKLSDILEEFGILIPDHASLLAPTLGDDTDSDADAADAAGGQLPEPKSNQDAASEVDAETDAAADSDIDSDPISEPESEPEPESTLEDQPALGLVSDDPDYLFDDTDDEDPTTYLKTFPLYRESPREFMEQVTNHCKAALESGTFGDTLPRTRSSA
jgi:hypothetical protein